MKILSIKYKLLYTIIYSLLLLSLDVNARHLPGDWKPAPQLGSAYNSHTHKVLKTKCVQAKEVRVPETEGGIKYTTQASFEEITRSFSGSLEAKIGIPFIKAGPSITYAQNNAATDNRINWFFEFHATPKNISLDLNELKLNNFEPGKCGNEFVYQVDLGAKLIATMSIEFASKEDKKEFEEKASVNVDWDKGSVSVGEGIKAIRKRMDSRTTVKIDVRQAGGNPANLASAMGDNLLNCKLSTIEACLEAFQNVLVYAKTDFQDQLKDENSFSPIRYHTMTYKHIPEHAFPILDERVKQKYEQLQEEYEKQALANNRAYYLKNKQDAFITTEQKANLQTIYKNSLDNMKKLTKAMTVCLEQPAENCLNQAENLHVYDVNDLEISRDKLSRLFKAVEHNNIKQAWSLLKDDINLISQNNLQGYSPFHRAIELGNYAMVDWLMAKDPFKNQKNRSLVYIRCNDDEEYTALCLAAKGGTDNHLICMNSLCLAGADVKSCQTKSELTPLQVAVMHGQVKTARELIKRGADIKVLDKHDNTLLHLAAEVGNVDLLRYLINKKSGYKVINFFFPPLDVNSANSLGLTPLHKAAHSGKLEAVNLLLEKGADPSIEDHQGQSATYWASAHEDILDKLKSHANSSKETNTRPNNNHVSRNTKDAINLDDFIN